MDLILRKKQWYLGEVGEEVSTEILRNCHRDNVFVVHKSPSTNNYMLSVRFPPIEGTPESLIDNFIIRRNSNGKYEITGESDVYDSIIDAINFYTFSRGLSSAMKDLSFSGSLTIPPEYNEANRQLGHDVAPLPNIHNVITESYKEVDANETHSLLPPPPDYMSNPHWWRYRDKCCCHPRNTWHCCCHRETYWSHFSRAELDTDRGWYDCKGTGFLRCLLLVSMWSCVWPCVGTGFLIYCCCICCGCIEDDD